MLIMSHFHGVPRTGQKQSLLQWEAGLNEYQVSIISAPVGAGKSRIAQAISGYCGGATTVVPNFMLVKQYTDTLPTYTTIGMKGSYASNDAYAAARKALKGRDVVCEYNTLLSHRLYSPVMIFDEAHNIAPHLRDKEAVNLWQHLVPWPNDIMSLADMAEWLEERKPSLPTAGRNALKKLSKMAFDEFTTYITYAEYRGKTQKLFRIEPLTPRNNAPILWPPHQVKKLVLLSATIGVEDAYDLGLDRKRVQLIDVPSPIPPSARPIVPLGEVNMSFRHQEAELPRLAQLIRDIAASSPHDTERGVVHAPYGLAWKLREHLQGDRYFFHTSMDKQLVFEQWQASPAGILVASGMDEGIDLAYDKARWQVATKVQWPSIADAAIRAKAALRPSWYQWQAIKHLVQLSGRVSRAPDDYGITYIADVNFDRLYRDHKDMFPIAFKEALPSDYQA